MNTLALFAIGVMGATGFVALVLVIYALLEGRR
jgi:hypothetical protein